MNHWLVGAAAAFVSGVCVSFLNYHVSLLVLRKKPQALPMTSVVRQFINVAFLVAVYFLAPHTPWNLIPLLIGAALGTTLSMFLFTYLLVRKTGEHGKDKR